MPESASAANTAYYEKLTPGQDAYWRKMAAPRARVARVISLVEELGASSVVDLGCGNGLLLEELRDALAITDLCGIDLSLSRIESNRVSLPWGEWHARDLSTPEPVDRALEARFDVVSLCEIVEHLDDPERVLRAARAMLVPRGALVLTTQSGPLRETERRVGHRRHFGTEEMRTLLVRSGFVPTKIWNEGWPFHDLSKWYANRNPDASLSRFAGGRYGLSENAVAFALRALFRLNSKSRGAQLYAVARRD